jgi:hypothetical protein
LHAAKPRFPHHYPCTQLGYGYVHHAHPHPHHNPAEDLVAAQTRSTLYVLCGHLHHGRSYPASLLRHRCNSPYPLRTSSSLTPFKLQQGQTAAIWSCREDIVAVIIGQATIVRPLFTRRFWNGNFDSSGYSSSKKPSNGYDSHELSDGAASKPSRLGFRPVKDPYNISVLQTAQGNESEEKIIGVQHVSENNRRESSQRSDESGRAQEEGITVRKEVDVSRTNGKLGFQQAWKPI